ncbi:MAG: hypothetical protein ABI600_20900 [Luteolibacter sp.]
MAGRTSGPPGWSRFPAGRFEEGGAGDTIFHGGFGMINVQGIVKPSFHAYRMLGGLGDELLATSDCGVVTRDSASGKLSALAFHYPPEMPLSVPASFDSRDKAYETLGLGQEVEFRLQLSGLDPAGSLLVEVLNADHGNAMAGWIAIGAPEEPTREQIGFLRQVSTETDKECAIANELGQYSTVLKLMPWSVVSVKEL